MSDKHAENLARVRGRIADTVLAFVQTVYRERKRRSFRMTELNDHVQATHRTAPASADRILRLLHQEGLVDYRVEDRRASLYVVTWFKGCGAARPPRTAKSAKPNYYVATVSAKRIILLGPYGTATEATARRDAIRGAAAPRPAEVVATQASRAEVKTAP